MSNPRIDSNVFTTGGTVQAGKGRYLARRDDDELLALCRQGVFAYILTARQMGKSSLMVRAAEQLASEDIRSVIIDLTQIGTKVTPEQWYLGVLANIEEQLELQTDVVAWWRQRAHLGLTQRLTDFFREVLLNEVNEPVVIFVDEIDTTLSLDFTDDFYAAIRYLYNARAAVPEFKRLSFVLIGVATPGDLIRDSQRTPFNIGHRVDLTDFTFEEALPLAEGLRLPPDEARRVLGWVMKWTHGHPYLTQRLCLALIKEPHDGWSEEKVDGVANEIFFGAMSQQDSNLQFVRDMLTKRAHDTADVLTAYREIRQQRRPVPDEERSLVKNHLKLSGVVRREQSALRVRNPIYAEVFDEHWINQHLRVDLVKRIKRVSVILAPYVAAVLIFLSLYAWWTVWTLSGKAAEAESRLLETRLKFHDVESALGRAGEELGRARAQTARLNEEAKSAKDEAETAKEDAARERETSERVRKAAETQREKAQQTIATADASLLIAESKVEDAKKEVEKLQTAANSARVALAEAMSQRQLADAAATSARNLETGAKAQATEAEGRLEAANKEIELARELQRAQDEQAKKEGFAKEIWRFHTGSVSNVAINPQNSKLIVTASADGTARVMDMEKAAAEKKERHILRNQGAVNSAVFSFDGQSIVTAREDGAIQVYDAETGEKHPGVSGSIGAKPLKTVQQWRTVGPAIGASSTTSLDINSRFVAVEGIEAGTLRVWDLTDLNGAPVVLRGHRSNSNSLAVSPTGQFIVAINDDNTIQVWRRTEPDKAFAVFPGHRGLVTSLAFSPNELLLATASEDKTAKIWDLNDPDKKPVVMDKHSQPLTSIAFSPSGKWVVTASKDGEAQVWVAKNGKGVAVLRKRTFMSIIHAKYRRFPLNILFPISFDWYVKGMLPAINSAAFSPDGDHVVTTSEDGMAQIWNVEKGKSVAALKGHILAVRSAVFTPDGTRVITTSADNTVRFWDIR